MFARMPFGLQNAPGTFKRAIAVVQALVKWWIVLKYCDDVVMFLRNADEKILNVTILMSLSHKAGVKAGLKNCKASTAKNNYLGHIIQPDRLKFPRLTNGIARDLTPPHNVTK